MANRRTKHQRRVNLGRTKPKKGPAQQLSLREQVKRRDQFLCRYCGEPGTTLDHVVPRSRGGKNTLDNLRYCCRRCNTLKGNMSLESFLPLIAAVLEWEQRRAARNSARRP